MVLLLWKGPSWPLPCPSPAWNRRTSLWPASWPATLPVTRMEPSDVAVAGFLARYREPTLSAYRRDLRCFWQWCADHQVEPLAVRRPHLELYLRELEQRGYAPATVSRRLSTVAGMFKYAVIDELVATNPSLAVTGRACRGKGSIAPCCTRWSSPPCSAPPAGTATPPTRLSRCSACWACASARPATHTSPDLRYAGGYELLRVVGKGAKPAEIPLPIPVLRAVKAAIEGRSRGPILLSAKGKALTRGAAGRLLRRVVREAGVTSPARLARTRCAGPSAPPG